MEISKVEEIRNYFAQRKVIETIYYVHCRQSKTSELKRDFELHTGISSDPDLEFLYITKQTKYADETPNFNPIGIHAEMIAKQKAGRKKKEVTIDFKSSEEYDKLFEGEVNGLTN